MNRALRTLLSALIVSASLALGGAASTSGAWAGAPIDRCPFISIADSSKAAMAVFTGTVTKVTEEPRTEPGSFFLHDVTVDQVYGDEIDTATVQVQSEKVPKECSLGELTVGTEYMFFVVSDGEPWIAMSGGGTRVANAEIIAKVVEIRGKGRDPVPAAPESAEFTPVNVDEPTTLSRAAAPGLALVLIGLLGLVVVRGLGRRRS